MTRNGKPAWANLLVVGSFVVLAILNLLVWFTDAPDWLSLVGFAQWAPVQYVFIYRPSRRDPVRL